MIEFDSFVTSGPNTLHYRNGILVAIISTALLDAYKIAANFVGAAAVPFSTLTNVTASRAFNTTYTNGGMPRHVAVSSYESTTGIQTKLIPVINGVTYSGVSTFGLASQYSDSLNTNNIVNCSFIVPAGATYRVNAAGSGAFGINLWLESV